MSKCTLITGGARSGKSQFAQELALLDLPVALEDLPVLTYFGAIEVVLENQFPPLLCATVSHLFTPLPLLLHTPPGGLP